MRRFLLIAQLLLWSLAAQAQTARHLDTTTFVVLGEGLAAGMANFGLNATVQSMSFPAQMAEQMGTAFPQPLIEPPGIADPIGYPTLPVRMPAFLEQRVRIFPVQPDPNDETPTLFILNLSVPNLSVADSLARRPVSPLIHTDDMEQTVINLTLGFPSLIFNRDVPLWSQLEYAVAMNPTFALVELGFSEALQAAITGDSSQVPDPATFSASYSKIVQSLRALQAQVLVTTIPNPFDTAYFTLPADAAALMGVPVSSILAGHAINPGDYITRRGLSEIGNQLLNGTSGPLPPGSIVSAATAADIGNRIQALNSAIASIAGQNGAVAYDLHGFIQGIHAAGASAGSISITGKYLGGFYSLDGVYPGPTGHALIANDILAFINRTYGTSFPLVDAGAVAAADATTQSTAAGNP